LANLSSADLADIRTTRDAGALAPEADVRDFIALLKPRVMSLVVFTGFVGLYLAPGHLHPFLAAVAVLCIAVGGRRLGRLNMWYDRDIDAVMRRTSSRPAAGRRMAPGEALGFGCTLAGASVIGDGIAVNWVAAALLAGTIAFYVFVYTMWLKRRTPQKHRHRRRRRRLPAVVGWAAVTGDIGAASLVLFALIFFWTPPHFWALSLYRAGDYAKAGVPMLPVVAGARETKKQMLIYTIVLWPIALAPALLGMSASSTARWRWRSARSSPSPRCASGRMRATPPPSVVRLLDPLPLPAVRGHAARPRPRARRRSRPLRSRRLVNGRGERQRHEHDAGGRHG